MQYSVAIAIAFSLSIALVFYFLPQQAYGVFHREDFIITDMGLKNGNPFMTVQGEAGRSFSVDMGDESFYSYTFVTDKGIFAASVALGEDENSPYYSVDGFEVDTFEVGACLEDRTASGEPRFTGNTAEYMPEDLVIENVSKVYTIQVTLDDPDDDCQSGQHIYKIFSSK
ncbi:hypothetical protein [Candidatus Nitrosocosmicus franklandus]|uniref:Uncharacterized protein n=1 Tax=Candidatus Nitrosocosmicus franklandianus TaxID=1798806 RepID=A0A484I458_9ARCH|nr:hypothetical protein [Candidatus Nitrosocosmicus franklandus]VFJ12546.1 conserved protein of unknown function [Candidatus Nitrosocosmicus franklandus]